MLPRVLKLECQVRRRPSSCHVASRPKLSVGFWIFEDQEVTEVTSLEMFRSEDPRSAGCLEGAPLHEERGTAGEHCSHHSSPSLAALRSRTGPRTWAQPQPQKSRERATARLPAAPSLSDHGPAGAQGEGSQRALRRSFGTFRHQDRHNAAEAAAGTFGAGTSADHGKDHHVRSPPRRSGLAVRPL